MNTLPPSLVLFMCSALVYLVGFVVQWYPRRAHVGLAMGLVGIAGILAAVLLVHV